MNLQNKRPWSHPHEGTGPKSARSPRNAAGPAARRHPLNPHHTPPPIFNLASLPPIGTFSHKVRPLHGMDTSSVYGT